MPSRAWDLVRGIESILEEVTISGMKFYTEIMLEASGEEEAARKVIGCFNHFNTEAAENDRGAIEAYSRKAHDSLIGINAISGKDNVLQNVYVFESGRQLTRDVVDKVMMALNNPLIEIDSGLFNIIYPRFELKKIGYSKLSN